MSYNLWPHQVYPAVFLAGQRWAIRREAASPPLSEHNNLCKMLLQLRLYRCANLSAMFHLMADVVVRPVVRRCGAPPSLVQDKITAPLE
jgi:hypothetical protein